MRRSALVLALALLLGAIAACRVPHPRGRWNVVVVLVDTLRADHVSAYGYPRPTTPHVDALARDAYLFTQARAQASCTFPSAASVLTSRYPATFLGQPGDAMGIPPGVRSLAELLAARGWSTAAVSASAVVRATPSQFNPSGGYGRGFARFDEDCEWREATCVSNHGLVALDRLREPFFLYLHYLDPHAPYSPPQPYRRVFRLGRPDTPWAMKGDPRPLEDMLYKGGPAVEYTPGDIRFLRSLYDGEISYFDAQLGRVLDELRRRDLLDRTVLALVSDHGESFMDHGDMGHCNSVYEDEIKTPFVLRLPLQQHGARIDATVQNLDLVPTLVDLLGVAVPAGQHLEGVSLLPLLDGAKAGERYAYALIGTRRSVTDGRFKLVHDLQSGRFALYDLQRDPGETHDVQAEQRPTFARLRQKLLGWIAHSEGANGGERGREALRRLRALGYL
jgi:arylsulfatase A-like enzyme